MGTEIGKDTMAPAITATTRPARRFWGWRALPLVLAVVLGLGMLLRPAQTARSTPLAPDFTLPAVAGGRGSLALHALRGHTVLLNFFNSKCPPCIEEMPILRQTAQAYRARGVIVLGVATGGDTLDSARQFAVAQHLTYPVALDAHQDVAWRKRAIAARLGSGALRGDAACSITCAYMAGTLLVGLALNALLGWWWADSLAALGLLYWLGREAREALAGARVGRGGCGCCAAEEDSCPP